MSFKHTPLCARDISNNWKLQKYLISPLVLLLLSLAPATHADADDQLTMTTRVLAPSLEVTPPRCVALHQGQICYQSAQLAWQAPQAGRFCLFISNDAQALKCWEQKNTGNFTFDFQSPHTLTFRLRNMHTHQDLVQTQLSVAWVYGKEKRRRTSWRLF